MHEEVSYFHTDSSVPSLNKQPERCSGAGTILAARGGAVNMWRIMSWQQ